jgi:hypothetical protein
LYILSLISIPAIAARHLFRKGFPYAKIIVTESRLIKNRKNL